MKGSAILTLMFVVVSLFGSAYADVPPDPGYTRVSLDLIVEPVEDLAEYRFFIKSGADLKEVLLKKGEPATIKRLGGGSYYRSGILLAVRKTGLASLSDVQTGNGLSDLKKAIYDGKVAGTIELIEHSFVRDVSVREEAGLLDPVYRIERNSGAGLKASQVSGGSAEAGGSGSPYSTAPKPTGFWVAVGGGSLMTLAFIFLGVWVIRRSKTKSVK
ncbi:hypothetical protein BH10ACI3_BH10ACI3_02900 [soil metagenome]